MNKKPKLINGDEGIRATTEMKWYLWPHLQSTEIPSRAWSIALTTNHVAQLPQKWSAMWPQGLFHWNPFTHINSHICSEPCGPAASCLFGLQGPWVTQFQRLTSLKTTMLQPKKQYGTVRNQRGQHIVGPKSWTHAQANYWCIRKKSTLAFNFCTGPCSK